MPVIKFKTYNIPLCCRVSSVKDDCQRGLRSSTFSSWLRPWRSLSPCMFGKDPRSLLWNWALSGIPSRYTSPARVGNLHRNRYILHYVGLIVLCSMVANCLPFLSWGSFTIYQWEGQSFSHRPSGVPSLLIFPPCSFCMRSSRHSTPTWANNMEIPSALSIGSSMSLLDRAPTQSKLDEFWN